MVSAGWVHCRRFFATLVMFAVVIGSALALSSTPVLASTSQATSSHVKWSDVRIRGTNYWIQNADWTSNGDNWAPTYVNWRWTGIQQQVDLARKAGLNGFRMIGSAAAVYKGGISEATYFQRIGQLASYLASKGMYFYPSCTSGNNGLGGLSATQVATFCAHLAANLDQYWNVVGIDLIQEESNCWAGSTPWGSYASCLALSRQVYSAAKAAAPSMSFTLSEAVNYKYPYNSTWTDYAPIVDYWDNHMYDGQITSGTTVGKEQTAGKLFVAGEFGGSDASYGGVLSLVSQYQFDVFQWAIAGDGNFALYNWDGSVMHQGWLSAMQSFPTSGYYSTTAPPPSATPSPTATPRTTATPAPPPVVTCSDGQYRAEYFGNGSLSGTPAFVRCENGSLGYDWANGGPGSGISADNFSARWTGSFPLAAGTYVFTVTADDGIKLWVDGTLVVSQWKDQAPATYQASLPITAGTHAIKVEYYEHTGGAVAKVSWAQGCSDGQYSAEYFGGTSLSGSPAFERCESAPLGHDWAAGGPGNGVGADNFSVRWTGRFNFNAATYTFVAAADDGVRVWIDGNLAIDKWLEQAATTYQATRSMTAGTHTIRMEYYERAGNAVAKLGWSAAGAGTRSEVIVDDRSGGFTKGGSYWRESTVGYGGHSWWTYVNGSGVDCWGEWRANLAGGQYEVFVFVPSANSSTAHAPYTVYFQGGSVTKYVSQSPYFDQWVSLGTYTFASGTTLRVRQTDATGESVNSRKIAFDSVKFVPR